MTGVPEPGRPGDAAALELQGYGALFGRKVVLASIDATLPAAGIDVLMGPVKTGKSTLMRSLCGLNDANRLFRSWGSARLLGRPVEGDWRPRLVQQNASMLNQPLAEAVLHYLPRDGQRSPAQRRAQAAGLLADHGLQALAAQLDAPLLSLPASQQRSVHILAMAAAQPPLLFVDEPTYGLDDGEADRLTGWLAALGRRCRLVVALHHQGQARRLADRILLLGGGRVIAHQPTEDFFRQPANELVAHFVRSGSLPIASPGAAAEDLEDAAAPQLPAAARAALQEFVGNDAEAGAPAPARTPASPPLLRDAAGPVAATSAGSAAQAAAPAPSPAPTPASAPAPAARITPPPVASPAPSPARLPLPLPESVDEASTVGRVTMPEYRGPAGFHWIVRGRLAACPEPGISAPLDYDLELLRGVGITHLVTLTEHDLDQDVLREHRLANVHLPIIDREAPTLAQAYMLLVKMQGLMARGAVLAVHCKAGLGRTGTILAAWLIRDGGLSATAALERLRRINPAFVQTEQQERFLHQLEEDLVRRL